MGNSLKDLLLQMSGCRVSTNSNGGNPNCKDIHKHKKYKRKLASERKPKCHGANIDLGHRFTEKRY